MTSRSRSRRSSRLRQKANNSSPSRSNERRGNQPSKRKETCTNRNRSKSAPKQHTRKKSCSTNSVRKEVVCPSSSTSTEQQSCRITRSCSTRGHHITPSKTPRPRSKSPLSRRRGNKLAIIRSLRKRIRAISVPGRPIPTIDNIKVLAQELKLRLASVCLPIQETGRRGGKVKVAIVPQRERVISMFVVTRDQDYILSSKEKVMSLRKRIRAISVPGRPIPTIDNIKVLAQELKLRLASVCLPIQETGRRGGKVKVAIVPQRERVISMFVVTRDQDYILSSKEKVMVTNWKNLSRQII